MTIPHCQLVESQSDLTSALQRLTREERGEIPIKLQTPAERRKSAAEIRALERSIERLVERNRKYRERTKNVSRGQY